MGSEISALTAASTLSGSELFHGVQSGNSRKVTVNQLRDYVKSSSVDPSISTDSGATHTVTAGDLSGNKVVLMSSASTNSVSVPVGLTAGGPLVVAQVGDGQTSFVAESGVTIRSADGKLKLRAKYSSASLMRIGTNEYLLVGDIAT